MDNDRLAFQLYEVHRDIAVRVVRPCGGVDRQCGTNGELLSKQQTIRPRRRKESGEENRGRQRGRSLDIPAE